MSENRKLTIYEKTLLGEFSKNFCGNFIKIYKKRKDKNIYEIFLEAICGLFDIEMAFIAEGKTRKHLNVKYIYPDKETIRKEILSLTERRGSYDDLRKANVEGLHPLVKEQVSSVLFVPIEAENLKIQYFFLCNRKIPVVYECLFTSYDLKFIKILANCIRSWLLLFSQREKNGSLFNLRFERELKTIIIRVVERYTKELTFKENDISKELQKVDKDEIKTLLKEAEDKIDMWYMPIVSLINNEIFGYEMLARDITKQPIIMPNDIFERAKTLSKDAIIQLECLCIKKVFEKIGKYSYPTGKHIFINIYPSIIFENQFEEILKGKIVKSNIIFPNFIVFEIIEKGYIHDFEIFENRIIELKKYGIRFADDDHGFGTANDERFLSLKPAFVKINKKYINNLLTNNAPTNFLIEGLVKATHQFNGYVIAKEIGRGDAAIKIIEKLIELGVTYGQGFHFGEPVSKITNAANVKKEVSRKAKQNSTIPESVKKAYNFYSLDKSVKDQILEIGECQFWNLLKCLLPKAEGTVSYMQRGRSGAYVFKILAKFIEKDKSPTRPKAWIIKLANEKELLELEVKKHNELIKTPLNRASYPKLFSNKPIICDNLAGIAFELEEDASSLMESFYKLSDENINIIISDISDILKSIYGHADPKIHMLWKNFYNLSEEGCMKLLSYFEENENIIEEKVGSKSKRVLNFVGTKGESEKKISNLEIDADTRTIHGDFNSRNILVNKNNKVVLIDFSERKQDHIAKDIAKLERDIIFRIFDASSPQYHEWSRLKLWKHFSHLNEKGNVLNPKINYHGNNKELKKSLRFICAIRNILKQLSPELDEREYLCALLHYSLLALIHSEISIQKKAFAVQYINQILETFN